MALTAPEAQSAGELTAFDTLAAFTKRDMEQVNALIAARMQSPVAMIPDLAAYLIEAGGKRLRPMITLSVAQLFDYQGDAHVKLAATVEFIHTATLLHDDVVDQSALRRGRRAANLVWGNAASVLVGDFLFARAFNLMVETGSLRVLDILSQASSTIAEGEVRQLAAAGGADASVSEYMAIIDAKTAALFAAAAEVGAVVADRSPQEQAAMRGYGRALGLAFQIADDVLDYGGVEARLGKRVGDDFREGKVTLPAALAMEAAVGEERAFWARAMAGEQTEDDFARALESLARHEALERALAVAREHAATAQESLGAAPQTPITQALSEIAEFVVRRAY